MTVRILPLPEEVVAQIKSSVAITSLTVVVLGLVQNAFDADAQNVTIDVDFRRGDCTVEDDGEGIAQPEFKQEGALGKPYCTSKYQTGIANYGSQGMFLASLSALSLITVTSRQRDRKSLNEVTFHRGTPVSRHVPAPSQNELTTGEHGTRITVRNLFGGMPVRVKQRARIDERSAMDEWVAATRRLVELLIAYHRPVNVILRDQRHSRKLNIRGLANNASVHAIGRIGAGRLKSLNSDLVLRILTQSGYIEPDTTSSWIPVSGKTSSLSIKGMISLDPAPNQHCQFISFESRPISNASGRSEVFEEINRIFSESDFGGFEDGTCSDEDAHIRRLLDRRYKQDRPTLRQLKGTKKGIDRWPMFYLRILPKQLSKEHYGVDGDFSEYQTKLKEILDVMSIIITRWLAEHYFYSGKRRKKFDNIKSEKVSIGTQVTNSSPGTLPTRRKLFLDARSIPTSPDLIQHPFSAWSRIKSGSPKFFQDLWSKPTDLHKTRLSPTSTELIENSVQLWDKDWASIEDNAALQSCIAVLSCPNSTLERHDNQILDAESSNLDTTQNENEISDSFVNWLDPVTKNEYKVNRRNGMMQMQRDNLGTTTRPRSRDVLSGDDGLTGPDQPTLNVHNSWLENFLKTWDNPVFHRSGRQIPQVSTVELSNLHRCSDIFDNCRLPNLTRISIKCLLEADVIAQVDRKFILIRVVVDSETPASSYSENFGPDQILILVDQHAADERYRIETLLNELCQPVRPSDLSIVSNLGFTSKIATMRLQKPIHFIATKQEYDLLRASAQFFSNWGIIYDLQETTGDTSVEQDGDRRMVIVTALPPGVMERCVQEPKLLIESLRIEIWRQSDNKATICHSNISTTHSSDATGDPHAWVRLIGDCPQSLIDMLNSRSCRSSVMFNDVLSLQKCQDLVKQVASCALPFQCAHGRPSMVPLVDIGGVQLSPDNDHRHNSPFKAAFLKWREQVNAT